MFHTDFKIHFDITFFFRSGNLHDDGYYRCLFLAKANAKRYRVTLLMSRRPKPSYSSLSSGNAARRCLAKAEVDRSEREISKLRRRRTPIREWWKKKRKIGECLFFVDVGSFIPSNYSSSVGSSRLHSLHCLRSTAKGFPNTPHPARRLLVYSSNISLHRPPPGSKMKIGWCSREIRGGRARLGGGRRSSRSRELSATCIVCRCVMWCVRACRSWIIVAILTLVIPALIYAAVLKLPETKWTSVISHASDWIIAAIKLAK